MIESTKLLDHYGYIVQRSYLYDSFNVFRSKFANYLSSKLSEYSGEKIELSDVGNFHLVLEKYDIEIHKFIGSLELKRKLPDYLVDDPFVVEILNRLSELLGKKYILHTNTIYFRVCRPNCDDSNDLHRDTWFPNYADVLNIYLPLSGSYNDSALQIVPFSHKWKDEDVKPSMEAGGGRKYIKNGVAYSAPTIGYSKYEIKPHRPDVVEGDFMIFDPKIIHGKGDNFSLETRFSFEFRIEEI